MAYLMVLQLVVPLTKVRRETNTGHIGDQFFINNISFVSNSKLLVLECAENTEFMHLFELLCEFQKTAGCYHYTFNYEFLLQFSAKVTFIH